MKILVTGGAGFIGSNIVDGYLAAGHEVVVVDNLSTGKKENLNPKAKFYKTDILDPQITDILHKEKPEVVNHHAAQIDVRKSLEDPVFDARTNILGTINVLENCVKAGVRKVIFASTGGALYGEPDYLPVDEKHPIMPISAYAASKYSVETYLKLYSQSYGLKYIALRYGNVYGPRQDPLGEAGVIAIFVGKMSKGEVPTIFGDGEQLRDYVYVGDIVDLNCRVLQEGEGVYNVGTTVGTSVNQIFSTLKEIMDFKPAAKYAPPRKGEVYKVYLNAQKLEKTLGWKPRVNMREGLKQTVAWFNSAR